MLDQELHLKASTILWTPLVSLKSSETITANFTFIDASEIISYNQTNLIIVHYHR